MSQWSRFYENRMTPLYRANLKRKYQPFLNLIANCNPRYLIEAGCGAAHITRLLHGEMPTVRSLCVDSDSQMLALATNNVRESGHSERVSFRRRDITSGSFRQSQPEGMVRSTTVIHSHGVLEHFNDKAIRSIIDSQLRVAPRLIHCVPSSRYCSKSYGDERLMPAKAWHRICSPSDIVEFNDGYELALIWR